MDTAATNLLMSSSPIEGLSAWIFNPLPQVGSNATPLDGTPSGIDHVAKFGCKAQNYTSWDSSSRSYLASYTTLQEKKNKVRRSTVPREYKIPEPDVPTPEDMEEWTTVDKDMWEQGKKKFYKEIGLLTVKQIAASKYQKMIATRSGAKCAPDLDKTTIPAMSDYSLTIYDEDVNIEDSDTEDHPVRHHHDLRSTRSTSQNVITDSQLWYFDGQTYIKVIGIEGAKRTIRYMKANPDSDKDSVNFKDLVKYMLQPSDPILRKLAQLRKWDPPIYQAVMDARVREFKKKHFDNKDCVIEEERGMWLKTDCNAGTLAASKKTFPLTDTSAGEKKTGTKKKTPPVVVASKPPAQDPDAGQSSSSKSSEHLAPQRHLTADSDDSSDVDPVRPPEPTRWIRAAEKVNPAPWELKTTMSSDTIPVRIVGVTTWKSEYEQALPIPYSPMYTSILQRLQDPAATGALGAMARGPSIRDATSLISLAKALSKTSSSVYEIAPLLRAGCIVNSLIQSNYRTEIIYHRVIRNWTTTEFIGPSIHSVWTLEGFGMIAMPLDIFVSFMLNKYGRDDCNDEFVYQGADSDWTAIPIRSELLGESTIIPYIAAFLSSTLWNGKICHRNRGYWTDPVSGNQAHAVQCIMPSSASVSIPGVKKAILVLVDFGSGYPPNTVTIGNMVVPVWKGTIPIPHDQIPDFADEWDRYFTTANIGRITTGAMSAFNEIAGRLGVENAALVASSILAELYLVNYQGMGVKTKKNSPDYDWTVPAYGAWVTSNRGSICKGSRLIGDPFHLEGVNNNNAPQRRRLVGYNFSGVSAWMRPPTGLNKTRTFHNDDTRGAETYWMYEAPEKGIPGYNVTTMDSITRVSTYVDLILTSEKNMPFYNSNGFASWHHMLSMALTFQATVLFTQSNINLAVWTGYDTRYDSAFSSMNMSKLIRGTFQGFVNFIGIKDLIEMWHEWDEDTIQEYYGVDPFDNSNWMSYSAIPYHATMQWIKKMKSNVGEAFRNTEYFRHMGHNHMGLKVTDKSGEYRTSALCTIDADRYMPMLVFKEEDATFVHMTAWVDQFSYITCISSNSMNVLNCSYLESQTFVLPPLLNGLQYTPLQPMYIVRSDFLNMTEEFKTIKATDILYPDPISLDQIISGAKRFLVDPVLAALLGFVRGGPVGALIGGGSKLAERIIEAKTSGNTQDALKEVVKKVEESAHNANYRIVHNKATHPETPISIKEEKARYDAANPPDMTKTEVVPNKLQDVAIATPANE